MAPVFGQITVTKQAGQSSGSVFQVGDKVMFYFDNITPASGRRIYSVDEVSPTDAGNPEAGWNAGRRASLFTASSVSSAFTIQRPNVAAQSSGAASNILNWGDSVTVAWWPDNGQTYYHASTYPLIAGENKFYFAAVDSNDAGLSGVRQPAFTVVSVIAYKHIAPSVDTLVVLRCDEDGTENVSGRFLKVKATWTDGSLAGESYEASATYKWGKINGLMSSPLPITAQNEFMEPVGGRITPEEHYVVEVTASDEGGYYTTRKGVVFSLFPKRVEYSMPCVSLGFTFPNFTYGLYGRHHFPDIEPGEDLRIFSWMDIDENGYYVTLVPLRNLLDVDTDNANFIEYFYQGVLEEIIDEVPDVFFQGKRQAVKNRMLANWPKVAVQLLRVPYTIAETIRSWENYAVSNENKRTFDRYTLVSKLNDVEVLDNVVAHEMRSTVVSATVLLDGEKLGDLVSIDTDFGVKTGYITKMDTDYHNRAIAKIEIRCEG